ncbi:CRISPR-associated ring nuclease Csm6 [Methylococcus geothermalis]|uniref:TIGR02584 family CRISPR-associated protein n=1 Tax=Methylococcus geothermalis TaxID=2681310 RepID=A0A858Q9K8_9GAMM|nr:CRISPR-associated ring nuclease Csm6 [Methylococcus geothermalis]QJD30445.1 TIGR02584 family CRISPR-associated protein [Methylococcus geothermalis]
METPEPRHPKRILLAVTGLTPQVVTETLYALWRLGDEALPTEIHLLSTAEGIERARLTLLSDEPGWFHRLRRDYALPAMHFTEACLHVLVDGTGRALTDIRTESDNIAAADTITDWIRHLTADDASQLHVSLAGGRKSMGFYAGYALSLYGRPQDRLSHVLVMPPYESHPDFFYPTPTSRIIYTAGADSRPLDTKAAAVTLADIPFVRLRQGLPKTLLKDRTPFSQAVDAAQSSLSEPKLTIDLAQRRIQAGGVIINLPPTQLAFLSWLARRRLAGAQALSCPADGVPESEYAGAYLAEYIKIIGAMGDGDRTNERLRHGMDKAFFEQTKSKLHRHLKDALGHAASPYLIDHDGDRPRRFGLTLPAEAIKFGAAGG